MMSLNHQFCVLGYHAMPWRLLKPASSLAQLSIASQKPHCLYLEELKKTLTHIALSSINTSFFPANEKICFASFDKRKLLREPLFSVFVSYISVLNFNSGAVVALLKCLKKGEWPYGQKHNVEFTPHVLLLLLISRFLHLAQFGQDFLALPPKAMLCVAHHCHCSGSNCLIPPWYAECVSGSKQQQLLEEPCNCVGVSRSQSLRANRTAIVALVCRKGGNASSCHQNRLLTTSLTFSERKSMSWKDIPGAMK